MKASDIPPAPTSFFVRIQDFDGRDPGDEGIGIRLLIYWEPAGTRNITCENFETTVEWWVLFLQHLQYLPFRWDSCEYNSSIINPYPLMTWLLHCSDRPLKKNLISSALRYQPWGSSCCLSKLVTGVVPPKKGEANYHPNAFGDSPAVRTRSGDLNRVWGETLIPTGVRNES